MNKDNRPNFTFKAMENNQIVQRCQTHSKRRFCRHLASIKWELGHTRVYLRISYGKDINNQQKIVSFYNDGEYENQEDLLLAFDAFCEEIVGKPKAKVLPISNYFGSNTVNNYG